jgi:hypothetical protein
VAYQGLEDRMDRLEVLVISFAQHTDEAIVELRQAVGDMRQTVGEVRQAVGEVRQGLMEQRQGLMEQRQDVAEMRQWRLQAQKQWGEIANKLGTFVEDIVVPNIPSVARQILGTEGKQEPILTGARLRVWHPQDRSRLREFDYIYATDQGWIVVESKHDPKLKDVDAFRELLAEAKDYFPQYAALPLYPVFAALSVPDHVVQYCTRHRIFALGLGPETMQLLNLADLIPPIPPQTTS